MFDNILAIGAHPDDLEMACFGSLLKFVDEGSNVDILLSTYGGYKNNNQLISKRRNWKLIQNEIKISEKIIGKKFKFLDNKILNLKINSKNIDYIDSLIKKKKYDLVITHGPGDSHQDHQATYKIVKAACRKNVNSLWLMEIAQYAVNNTEFKPNVFVDITKTYKKKISAIKAYKSYIDKKKLNGIEGLATYRSMSVEKSKYAEAFQQEFMKY